MKANPNPIAMFLPLVLFALVGCLSPQLPKPPTSVEQLQRMHITLPTAPDLTTKDDGPDPTLIRIDITSSGTVSIACTPLSLSILDAVLCKAVAEYGTTIPLCFRADQHAPFAAVWECVVTARKHRLFRFCFAARGGSNLEFFAPEAPLGDGNDTLTLSGERGTFNGKEVTIQGLRKAQPEKGAWGHVSTFNNWLGWQCGNCLAFVTMAEEC